MAVYFQILLLFCGGDTFLPESRLLGTMVTTSLQGSLPQRLRHFRHLQMPPDITLQRARKMLYPERRTLLMAENADEEWDSTSTTVAQNY